MYERIKWGPGREAQCLDWLDSELTAAKTNRQPLERLWQKWLEAYAAPALQPTKDFPFVGASNKVIPFIATDLDQLFVKEMTSVFAQDNIWTLEPLNENWVRAAKPLQDALTWLDWNSIHMWEVCKRLKLEKYKLGTAIYKTGWLYEQRPIWTYDPNGKRIRATKTRGRPFVDHVRLPDFLMPPYSYAIQPDAQGGAPWTAERHRMDVDRVRSMLNAGMEPPVAKSVLDQILKFTESADTEHDQKIQQLDYTKSGSGALSNTDSDAHFDTDNAKTGQLGGQTRRITPRELEIWEIHARFPTGGRGGADNPSRDSQGENDSQDDIVVWYHQPTRQFIRSYYLPFHHGERPYEVERMFPGDGFYGIGLCQQKEMFQDAGSELINFMFDNVLLGNSIGIAAKAGANIAPGEPVYPGKTWITEGDPRAELHSFQLGQTRADLPMLIQMFQALGERRTGIGDLQLGNMQQLPGRTPATTTLSLLQEGNRRPDFTIKDSRYEGLARVGIKVLQLLQQYIGQPQDVGGRALVQLMTKSLGMPEGLFAAEKMIIPQESAELGLGVSITATSGSANKEVSRQNKVALLQLAGQLTPQFIQLISVAQQAQGTPVGQVALESAKGLRELYQSTLEDYDIRNIEDVAPDIAGATQALDPAALPGQNGAANGPLAGSGGLVAPTGGTPQLADVLASLGIGG